MMAITAIASSVGTGFTLPVLMGETIRHAVQAGLQRYEFLGDVEPWTQVWTEHEHRCIMLDVYPYSGRGMAALARATASAWKRKWKSKHP